MVNLHNIRENFLRLLLLINKWYSIPLILVGAYLIESLVLLRIFTGILVYICHSLLWFSITVVMLWILGRQLSTKWSLKKPFIIITILISFLQIFMLVVSGVFSSFGRSPYVFTPDFLLINLIYFISTLFGAELSRACLIDRLRNKGEFIMLSFTSLLLTLVLLPLPKTSNLILLSTTSFTEFLKSFCSDFLPFLAENLLASYLVALQGPIPSIVYRGIVGTFYWISPILPNPTWSIKSLFGILAPILGFLIIDTVISTGRATKKEVSQKWLHLAIIFLLGVYFSTGLLGVHPVVIASGSMRPTMDVGDLAIVIRVPVNKIEPGDIIQFVSEEGVILHRVISLKQAGSTLFFVTKGDANNAPDPEPVTSSRIRGKLLFVIPKIGWIKIYLQILAEKVWNFLTEILAR